MAIRSGQILHDAYGFIVDRIQTGGVSSLNIPQEKIYELGNYQTVATVRDIPDLSFDLESFDVSTEIEALIVDSDPTTVNDGDFIDLKRAVPLDMISPYKNANLFTTVRGVALPYLTLESASYRFGLRQNATQAFTFRGDSIYYVPGTPYYQEFALAGTGPYTLANTALPYNENGETIYALGVCYTMPDGTYKRLFHGVDYTDTATAVTLTVAPPTGAIIKVIYGSAAAATYNQAVHQGVSVKPAAVRGKDIDVYVGDVSLGRWASVQSAEINWRVNLENDEEFGNYHFVSSDYDVPEVTGNIVLKPQNPTELFERIREVANVSAGQVIGPFTSIPLDLEVRISNPDTGARLKTFYVEDARFTVPAIQGRVQEKLTVTFDWESDGGNLLVYRGER
jgi:hypothetical protein